MRITQGENLMSHAIKCAVCGSMTDPDTKETYWHKNSTAYTVDALKSEVARLTLDNERLTDELKKKSTSSSSSSSDGNDDAGDGLDFLGG